MSEWHLDQLRAALTQRGWKILAIHEGDHRSVSGSWEVQRTTRRPPLWIDFSGLDELRCLPMAESYACQVRDHAPWLYFRRPGDKWRAELECFLRDLDVATSFPRPTLPLRRIEDAQTMSDMLAAERAILCLHAEWSMPSAMAWKSFQKWAGEREIARDTEESPALPVFVAINGDGYPPSVRSWLTAQRLDQLTSAGSGEVLWIERGHVVSALVYSTDGILPELTRRTAELWGTEEPTS